MTELERRALLGDPEAQRECTEKGIVLPCPFCGSEWTQVRRIGWENTPSPFKTGYRGECTVCHAVSEAYITREEALSHWNTRPAPPIGRCGECKHWGGIDEYGDGFCHNPDGIDNIAKSDDFCSYFEPKEREENGMDKR